MKKDIYTKKENPYINKTSVYNKKDSPYIKKMLNEYNIKCGKGEIILNGEIQNIQ